MKKQDKDTFKLNKEQIKAIKHDKGPLLIIAGAGTGKTTVITERVKYLISKGFAKPEEILALTFTEKAATEMEERVDMAMPLSYGDIFITTFHSFCDRLLRDEGLHVGIPTNFKLMNKEQSINFFRKNLFNFKLDYFRPLGNPNKFIEAILGHFSRLQDETVTPKEYLEWVKTRHSSSVTNETDKLEQMKWKELANVYKEYDQLKLDNARFDFGDLIIKSIELFKKRPNILREYQERFKYILVDEFQDTNFAQNELVNLLTGKNGNLTVVGDDNQAIYRWRGAAISNILQFKKNYPKAKTITLNTNYRSTQKILDSAYKLIKHNDPDTLESRLGISKKLKSCIKNNELSIEYIQTDTGDGEVEWVSDSINQLISKSGYKWSDIAILVRANNHADIFVREFERRGIPHQFLGPSKLLGKEEILDLISYLKSLYDPEDNESFYRFLSSSFFDIKSLGLIKATGLARKKSLSLYEVVKDIKKFKKPLEIFLSHLKQINKKTAGEILYEYLNETQVYQKILENEEDLKAKNIANFFNKIKTFENENPKALLPQVVDYISLLQEVGESPSVNEGSWQDNDAVNILTVHSAKGLEFPIVFLVNLVSDRFPSRNRSESLPIPDELIKEELPSGYFHLQEERRLFYVAMTRAKERLFLTAALIYGDGKREKKLSPFVLEALGENVESSMQHVVSTKLLSYKKDKSMLQATSYMLPRKIEYLSVSQIETFKICPLHYKLKYIYNIPTPMTPSISFGISIHETLQKMYSDPTSRKVTQGSLERLVFDYYKESFREEGYLNKKHKQEFYKKGESYLLGFLKNGYNSKTETISLEEKFTVKINPTSRKAMRDFASLKIGGKIDRIDKLENGDLEIIDYKTGATIPTQRQVDKNLQLSVYALAASELYKVKTEDIKLSLYFLDTQEKITTKRTKKDLEDVKKDILKVKEEIENSDFKCSNHYFCQTGCEFSMFCKSETT